MNIKGMTSQSFVGTQKGLQNSAIKRCCLLLFFVLLMLAKSFATKAQNAPVSIDTSVVAAPSVDDSEDYDNDEVADTTADTAKVFFNEKESFAAPFTQKKLQPHANSDTTIQRLRKEDDFWYVTTVEKIKADAIRIKTDKKYKDSLISAGVITPDEEVNIKENKNYNIHLPWWTKYVLWGIIISIFVFAIVYFLAANKINFFSRKSASTGAADVLENDVNIFELPYSDMLKKAYAEQNYRLAVRILYLQTLKMLSEKQVIQFQPDFTNLHYLGQLSQTNYYNDFFTITRHYEYVWYGEFSVPEPVFEKIKTDFLTIQNKMPGL